MALFQRSVQTMVDDSAIGRNLELLLVFDYAVLLDTGDMTNIRIGSHDGPNYVTPFFSRQLAIVPQRDALACDMRRGDNGKGTRCGTTEDLVLVPYLSKSADKRLHM